MGKSSEIIGIICFAGLFALAGLACNAAPVAAEELPSIAVLSSRDGAPYEELAGSFRAELFRRYPQATFSYSLLRQDKGADQQILQSIRHQNPNLILALGTSAVLEVLREFPETPLIASMVINDDCLAGAEKATGILLRIPPGTHLLWLHRFFPELKRVAIIYNPAENQSWVAEAENVASSHGLEIIPIKVDSPLHLPRALKELNRKAEILLGVPDNVVYSGKTAKMVLLSSFRSRIPFVGLSQSWVKAGGVYGLDWDYGALGRECALAAVKILGGTRPGDIPVRTPVEHLIYVFNLKTLRYMHLDIDPEHLAGAAVVFK